MELKKGVRTSEFWLTLLALGVLVAASLAGVDVHALESAALVVAYVLSRGVAKHPTTALLPIPTQPPPPPPPPPEDLG
jgi:hypothetical protein